MARDGQRLSCDARPWNDSNLTPSARCACYDGRPLDFDATHSSTMNTGTTKGKTP